MTLVKAADLRKGDWFFDDNGYVHYVEEANGKKLSTVYWDYERSGAQAFNRNDPNFDDDDRYQQTWSAQLMKNLGEVRLLGRIEEPLPKGAVEDALASILSAARNQS